MLFLYLSVVVSSLTLVFAGPRVPESQWTDLDRYVFAADSNYGYYKLSETRGADYTIHMLVMTSQRWMDDTFSSESLWQHHLAVIIPDNLRFLDAGVFTIEMGSQDDPPPVEDENEYLRLTAKFSADVGVVGVLLRQVPNQPITFPTDARNLNRFEDDLIAYTWRKYIEDGGKNGTGRPESILQLPMTKACRAALDAAQNFCYTNNQLNVTRFLATGASKRGWATYLIAAVDDRIVAMAPQVFSILNFIENIKHHYRSLGGYTFAFGPYWRENLTYHLDDPVTHELVHLIDPYDYRSRFNGMPKLLIGASGDEFFLNDDSHYFWNDMPGPKYFWMMENVGHPIFGFEQDVMENIAAFYKILLNGWTFPEMTWTRETTPFAQRITLNARAPEPNRVMGFESDTTDNVRRDWRLARLPLGGGETPVPNDAIWIEDTDFVDLGDGEYRYEHRFEDLTGGLWKSFFLEARFDLPDGDDLLLTTECQHIPDVFPFAPCSGDQCYGKLV